MAVALIADAHLGGPGGSPEPLLAQLRELPGQGCDRVLFLGDLFHIWVGDPRYETPEIGEFLPVLDELRGRGLELYYVEGNRDFFLDSSAYARYFDVVATEVALEVGGKRYLAVHGDGLNDRDWRYLFWRFVSKSAPSRFFSRRLPARLAQEIVVRTDRCFAQQNFKHKLTPPLEAIKAYGERRLDEGYDVLLLGHFHEALEFELPAGTIRVLPAWYHDKELVWLRDD